jgi:hypothetical protein
VRSCAPPACWVSVVSFAAPGSAAIPAPKGQPISTQLLATHLCGIGQDLERWIYPGQSHAGVINVYFGDMVHWFADQFAGDPNPDPYQPVGLPGVQTTTCPSPT